MIWRGEYGTRRIEGWDPGVLAWSDGAGAARFADGDVVIFGSGMEAVPGMELWRRMARADLPGVAVWLGVHSGDVGVVRGCFPGSEADAVLSVSGDVPEELLQEARFAVAWRVGSGAVFWGPPTEEVWDEFVGG